MKIAVILQRLRNKTSYYYKLLLTTTDYYTIRLLTTINGTPATEKAAGVSVIFVCIELDEHVPVKLSALCNSCMTAGAV